MKKQVSKNYGEAKREKFNASKSFKKNKKRLGGGGLSLEAFANAKSISKNYNPALIKKQREFYNNAKHVSKYKKLLKQQTGTEKQLPTATIPSEDSNRSGDGRKINKKNKKSSVQSLKELYEKKREEEEKARTEREAIIQTKKEEREKAEVRRKAMREKMFKKTRSGQPVMKYRMEHLLESIQQSTN